MIDEAFPNTPAGTPMTLVIDGVSAELTGLVARKDATATFLRFELSEETKRILSELVSTRQAA